MVIQARRTLAMLVCALAAAPALAAEKAFDKHFNVPPGGQFTLDTDVGSVVIVGREKNEVVIHADLIDSDDFLSRLEVGARQDTDGITVTGRVQRRAWFDGLFGFGQHKVLFTVEVPSNYGVVETHTSGGSLDVRHLHASVRGTTSGGSVTIRDVRGSVYARTSGGRIDAAELNGPAELRTSGGSIEVGDCTGALDVSTSGGGIHLEGIGGKVRAVTSGGGVEAEIRANRGVSLATSGGSITLLLPANVNGSIDAYTSGGRVESAIPFSSTEIATRNELRGTVNGGGEPILLRTSGGSIRVGPLD